MTDQEIAAICDRIGAKVVSEAAYAAMSGNRKPLEMTGIEAHDIATLNRIAEVAYKLMDSIEQADDLARATIDGAKLP